MTPHPRDELRAAGLRATTPRVAALTLLREGGHYTVDALAGAVRERTGAVSTQAVYDVADALVAAGLARTVEPAGSPRLYEARVADNHHHLVCRSCGAVEDVDCIVGESPCLTPPTTHGFAVDEAEITYWGRCPACRARPDQPHTDQPGSHQFGTDQSRTDQSRTDQSRTDQPGRNESGTNQEARA